MVEWLSLLTTILFQASSRGHIRGPYYLWHSRWKRRRKKIDALLKKNQYCGGSSNAKESRHALEQVSINSDSPGRGQRGRRGPKVSFQWGEVRVLDLLSELILLTSIILFYLSFSFIHFTAFPHGIYIGSLLGTGPAVWWFQAMATVWLIRFFPLDHQNNSLLLCLLGGFGTWCSDEINARMVQGSYPLANSKCIWDFILGRDYPPILLFQNT